MRGKFVARTHIRHHMIPRKTEKYSFERSLYKPSSFETEIATENIERYKSAGFTQIPAELI
jgi:hypothetical protein